MATIPVIDHLDRCKIALQHLAEMQSDRLTVVMELVLEQLDIAIGQAHAQLRQCTCTGPSQSRVTATPAPRGVLTLMPGSRQTSRPPVPMDEELYDEDERPCSDA